MANMRKHLVATVAIVASPALGGCVGTTGSGLVDFDAFASGPSDASGAPGTKHAYTFLSPYTGYTITLETAMLQIGAVYLDATPCNGSSEVTSCVDQNAETVAQVNGGELGAYGVPMSGVLVDALSPEPQSFIGQGSGIVQAAGSAEVWLVSPDQMMDGIDDVNNATAIATIAGTATKDGESWPFTASVSIGQNRELPAQNPALPGQNPICLQRIVKPICLSPALSPAPSTSLNVTVDPKAWFNDVHFSELGASGGAIPDSNDDANGRDLFKGIKQSSGVYAFSFQAAP
jgi:hypothetical protein